LLTFRGGEPRQPTGQGAVGFALLTATLQHRSRQDAPRAMAYEGPWGLGSVLDDAALHLAAPGARLDAALLDQFLEVLQVALRFHLHRA
jgi:hypothetical protein